MRLQQQKELDNEEKAAATSEKDKLEAHRASLKKESDRLKDLFNQLSSQFGRGLLPGMTMHKICFCIKDKSDELEEMNRQRLDSLVELTSSQMKRHRTKSEAVQDISSSSICEYVSHLLSKEFKVFDKAVDKQANQSKESQQRQLEQSLKLLKVLNFLYSNQDIITNKGIQFMIKAPYQAKKES